MTTEKDIYDLEVERLTAEYAWNDEAIELSWIEAGPLFGFVTPSRNPSRNADGKTCGCLTMIRDPSDLRDAWTESLTVAIRSDERLPTESADITPAHLPIFAEWQRKIDAALGRTPPAPA